MGLDVVEAVMEIEERFDVSLPDEEVSQMNTVADLAALVFRRVAQRLPPRHCAQLTAFYHLRRLLIAEAGVTRRDVRPDVALGRLLPRRRRDIWTRIRAIEADLPALELRSPWRPVLRVIRNGTLTLAGVPLWLVATVEYGCSGAFVASLAAVSALWLFGKVEWLIANDLPRSVKTVADAVYCIAPLDVSTEGKRLAAQQAVLDEVRRIVAEATGFPVEKVRPESVFCELT
ncbi:MAG: acyl carrier protein [Phycisphaerales bacterium]|nr:acyl carrier protein [Phycisphaerales bacterium]